MAIITAALALVAFAFAVKLMLWSGYFPPDSGWSKRQMDRMESGKSPWTWACWVTHRKEREAEIEASCAESKRILDEINAGSESRFSNDE